ncbi:MAG TPA: response regulator transcription factor [Chloroflexi bacterium]|nr:response regulator transcription factor [Chloroflexota bacterium]
MSDSFALVIEDDENLSELFVMSMQAAGFETEAVLDGQEALERLEEVAPDVVVLDLHLPRVSGETILKYIRGENRLANTRVMLATADGQAAHWLLDDSDIILLKPISPIQMRTLASRLRSSAN